jgi:hypothetical protein
MLINFFVSAEYFKFFRCGTRFRLAMLLLFISFYALVRYEFHELEMAQTVLTSKI